jgi:hypothetical protein
MSLTPGRKEERHEPAKHAKLREKELRNYKAITTAAIF